MFAVVFTGSYSSFLPGNILYVLYKYVLKEQCTFISEQVPHYSIFKLLEILHKKKSCTKLSFAGLVYVNTALTKVCKNILEGLCS